MKQQKIEDKILVAALAHVPFDGWGMKALKQGAVDLGLPPDRALRAFPYGALQAAEHFADYADRQMLAELDRLDLQSMRVRDRVAAGLRLRLQALGPHRKAVQRLLSFLARPGHGGAAAKMTCKTVDAIWYAADDTSADFNYYSKRGLLLAVYTATLLCWLGDDSDDFAETWGFLDRRLAEVLKIPAWRAKLARVLSRPPWPAAPGMGGEKRP
ncbi:MAG TPA: COQ9 family protein [Rhodospirillales bacterium]|jgi:ubiquinone biosynthesis protein COQ9|nr:COQ9 family protein [Rhodospirillales bacterium]